MRACVLRSSSDLSRDSLMNYRYHHDTTRIVHANIAQCPGTIAAQETERMYARHHPLLIALDALLQQAAWHKAEMEAPIADDGYAGVYWLAAIANIRNLFSAASPAGFDGGTCEAVFWQAMEIAGFTEADL